MNIANLFGLKNGHKKAIRPHSPLHVVLPGPKWYIFEGNLDNNKDLDEYADALSKIILDAKSYLCVIGGELCSKVWNNSKVIYALKSQKAKNVDFICGPMFDIKNQDFIKLVKQNKINLWCTKERQNEHFRLTDNAIFIEGYHKSFMGERNAIICKNSKIVRHTYFDKFKKIKDDENIDKVDAKDILSKFKAVVFDSKDESNYRAPSKDENAAILQIISE